MNLASLYSSNADVDAGDVNVRRSPTPPIDEEERTENAFSDEEIRLAFIRKVYLILMSQFTFTVVCICICLFSSTIKDWVQDNLWIYITAYCVFVVTFIALVCCPNFRKRVPANYICLAALTVALSFMAAVISSFHDTVIVLVAMGITAVVCFSVTIFTIQTKINFTTCHSLLFATCMVLFLCAVTCFIFFVVGFYYYLNVLFSGIIAMIFVLVLVYDTQLVVGGRRGYQLSPEEYITGALELYVDVIYVFCSG